MKITKTYLRQVIKEELDAVLAEEEEGSGEESTKKLSPEEWLENLPDKLQQKWEDEFVKAFKKQPAGYRSADKAYEAANNALLLSDYEKYLNDSQSEDPPADDSQSEDPPAGDPEGPFQAYPHDALPF